MQLSRSTVLSSVVLVALVAGGALIVTRFPTVSVGSVTIQTPVLAGLISGILLVPSIFSHYRSGEQRESVRWTLFAVGVPLSLTQRSPINLAGVLIVFLSLAVAWEIDRRFFGTTPQ